MKDLTSKIKFVNAFGPVSLAADATAVIVDTLGYHSAVLDLGIGIGGITFDGSNYIEFTLQHSDDGVTGIDVALTDLSGVNVPTSIVTSQDTKSSIKRLIAAHAAAANYKIGYIGGKRYLHLDIEFTGTHGAATPIHWKVILGDAELLKVD